MSETVFPIALDFLKRWEGIDSDHPNDSGGRTRFGISQAAYPNLDISSLTWDDAVDLYRRGYWNASGAFKSPPDVAFALFDSAVQHGPVQAVRLLQRAVGADPDGVYGPKTEAAIESTEHPGLEMLSERGVYYYRILDNDQSQGVFALGWMRRLIHAASIVSTLEVSR